MPEMPQTYTAPFVPTNPPARTDKQPVLAKRSGVDLRANGRGQKSSRFLETIALLSARGAAVQQEKADKNRTLATLNAVRQMNREEIQNKMQKQLEDTDLLRTVPELESEPNRRKYYEMQLDERKLVQTRVRILKAQHEILDAQKKHGFYLTEEEQSKLLLNAATNPTANPFSKDMTGLDKALTEQEKQLRQEFAKESKSAEQNVTTLTDMSKGVRLKDGLTLHIDGDREQARRKTVLMTQAYKKETPAQTRPTEMLQNKIARKEEKDGTLAAEALRRRIGVGLG